MTTAYIQIPNVRHLRHRKIARFRKNPAGTYRGQFVPFLLRSVDALDAPEDALVVDSVNNSNNTIRITDHGFIPGDGPFAFITEATLPAELDDSTEYFVSIVSSKDLRLHLTEKDGINGTNVVAFTDNGTGSHKFGRVSSLESIFDAIRRTTSATVAGALTIYDIPNN